MLESGQVGAGSRRYTRCGCAAARPTNGAVLRSRRNVCCIKLTSGTTGELKPILCSASNLVADGKQIIRTMGIRPADRNLAVIPLGHSYGLGNLVMPLLLQGTSVACAHCLRGNCPRPG